MEPRENASLYALLLDLRKQKQQILQKRYGKQNKDAFKRDKESHLPQSNARVKLAVTLVEEAALG